MEKLSLMVRVSSKVLSPNTAELLKIVAQVMALSHQKATPKCKSPTKSEFEFERLKKVTSVC